MQVDRKSQPIVSSTVEHPKINWPEGEEPEVATGVTQKKSPRRLLTALGIGGVIGAGVVGIGVAGDIARQERADDPVDFSDLHGVEVMPDFKVDSIQKAIIEAGISDSAASSLLSEWIETSVNPYLSNIATHYKQVDVIPTESISDNPNSIIVNELKRFVLENVDEENKWDIWKICPTTSTGDRSCITSNGETMQSDINLGPTDELYNGLLVVLRANSTYTTYFDIPLGNTNSGPTYSMVVTPDNKLITR